MSSSLLLYSHLLLEVHHVHEVLRSRREARPHLLDQTLHLLHVDAGAARRAGPRPLEAHDDPTHQNTASTAQGEQLGHKQRIQFSSTGRGVTSARGREET